MTHDGMSRRSMNLDAGLRGVRRVGMEDMPSIYRRYGQARAHAHTHTRTAVDVAAWSMLMLLRCDLLLLMCCPCACLQWFRSHSECPVTDCQCRCMSLDVMPEEQTNRQHNHSDTTHRDSIESTHQHAVTSVTSATTSITNHTVARHPSNPTSHSRVPSGSSVLVQ